MRTLVVYHFYAHYREPILRELANSTSHDYVFITGDAANLAGLNPIKELNIEPGRSQPFTIVRNYWFKRRMLWQRGLISELMSGEYDAVIYLGNAYFLTTWLGAIISRLRGKRTLMWSHGLYGDESWWQRKVRTWHYSLAHGLMLYGNWSRRLLLDRNFESDSLYVIYNSLNVPKQDQLYKELVEQQALNANLFDDTSRPTLIFIGRLTKQKKIHMLLEAAAILKRRKKLANILIIGAGDERNRLESRAEELSLSDCVCFYGACFDEDTNARLIYCSDICIAPGEVGLTAMHAMAYGTPVITHSNRSKQMPEFEAIIDGESGTFFTENDSNSLANSVDDWLTNHTDRQKVREDCRRIIHRYFDPRKQARVIDAAVSGVNATQICDFMDYE